MKKEKIKAPIKIYLVFQAGNIVATRKKTIKAQIVSPEYSAIKEGNPITFDREVRPSNIVPIKNAK